MKIFPSFRLFRYFLREALPFVFLTLLILTVLILAQQITRQSDLLFNSLASLLLSLRIISFLLPGILVITLPFSLLIGSLMALNRLSADNEIIAARASGMNLFQIAQPLLFCGLAGVVISGILTLRVIPSLVSTAKGLRAELLLALLAAPLKPQTFNTQFPNHLVYTRDIDPTTGDWLGVFIIRSLNQDQSLVLTSQRGRLRMTQASPLSLEIQLTDGLLLSTSVTEPQKQTLTTFEQQEIKLSTETPAIAQALEKDRNTQELSLRQLSTRSSTAPTKQEQRQASVEWHKRFSLPFACLILIILAVPLGLTTARQTGRAVAFTIGFAIAVLYYLILIAGQNFALAGNLPAWLGLWLPNFIGILFAAIHYISWPAKRHNSARITSKHNNSPIKKTLKPNFQPRWPFRRPVFLSLINYLLVSELIKYFLLSLSILTVTSLIFTLFDLLPSLNRSGLGWQYAAIYLLFLSPQIAYYVTPFALLLAALTAHGVLSRSNQLTALLTTGQSSARLLSPLILCVFIIIAGSLWLSEAVLPFANQEQDARYNRIKGKKLEQSVLALGRYWVRGEDGTIYGFQFNNPSNTLLNTTAYRISISNGRLLSLLQVQEAQPINEQTWRVARGWQYEINSANHLHFQILPLAKLDIPDNFLIIPEGATLFRRIVNEAAKMSFQELRAHIRYLSRLGVNTSTLRVDLEKKLAFPFSCLPLIVLAFPLAFKTKQRGTLTGVGLSIIIGFTFWIASSFFEGLGRQSFLPPGLSVWGTQALFLALGFFLLFRLRK
jgi:LPS export ABC transporter permease LptF/LPS export ABC transporter permease LptG